MKNNNSQNKISYEPKTDVLVIESSKKPIDHAKEIGNVIVHFTKNDEPVLFEILEASRFLMKAEGFLEKSGVFKMPVRKHAVGVN